MPPVEVIRDSFTFNVNVCKQMCRQIARRRDLKLYVPNHSTLGGRGGDGVKIKKTLYQSRVIFRNQENKLLDYKSPLSTHLFVGKKHEKCEMDENYEEHLVNQTTRVTRKVEM